MANGETKGNTYYFPTLYEKEAGGYGVHIIPLPNIFTVGPDLATARKNALEAIESHLAALSDEERRELDPYIIPPPEPPVVEVIPITFPKPITQ